MAAYDLAISHDDVGVGFIAVSRMTLEQSMQRVEHAVGQLEETDVWWRPHETMNAVGNLLLHLAGNVGQWMVAGVGGEPFTRDRPAEFAHRDPVFKAELLERLRSIVAAADRIMASLSPEALNEQRQIQGYDISVLGAIYHVVAHFEGHAQEIVYITRMRRGSDYEFLWQPSTPQQISAHA